MIEFPGPDSRRVPGSPSGRAVLRGRAIGPGILGLLLAVVFGALGVWQIQRLAWKTRLIASVQAAMAEPPMPVRDLPSGGLAGLSYRAIGMSGHFVPAGTTLVTGTSDLGSGYWVMVPLSDKDGRVVYINRGWVPLGTRLTSERDMIPAGEVTVYGLLRPSEPAGTWLRANRPADERWYSRDIAAIAARRQIAVDPRLFIDATRENPAQAAGDRTPVPGLTVVRFANDHLGYAITWFTLAVMAGVGGAVLLRRR